MGGGRFMSMRFFQKMGKSVVDSRFAFREKGGI